MRIDVKKLLFIGAGADKKEFFEKAQNAGLIHFIEKNPSVREIPSDALNIASAIKVLRGLPVIDQEDEDDFTLADSIADQILGFSSTLAKLAEEERASRLEMDRIEVFGSFSMDDIRWIEKQSGRVFQFFFAKKGFSQEGGLPEEVIYIGSAHELDYFVAINKHPKAYEKMVEMKIDHCINDARNRNYQIKQEIHRTEQTLKGFAKYNAFLHQAFIQKLNNYELRAAEGSSAEELNGSLFAIEGWVPKNKEPALQLLLKSTGVHSEEVAISPLETIPTYLENKGPAKMGEDLVHIYDTPSHTDKDPSLWVFFCFALFFSIIVGDAGYGLVYLSIALYYRYRYPSLKGAKKRVLNLFTFLSFGVIVWGVLTTSFFGLNVNFDNPIRNVSLMKWLVEKKTAFHIKEKDSVYQYWIKKYPFLAETKNASEFVKNAKTIDKAGNENYDLYAKFSDNILLELSLFIGVVHILLSMLRYIGRNWAFAGWILVLLGAYLYLPAYLEVTSLIHYVFGINPALGTREGLYLIYAGISLALLLSLLKNGLSGLLEPMTGVQILADTLSYLRLYALGLAGSIFSSTINELAGMSFALAAVVILLLGHGINILLSIMGGVIHGLRLNFLEWYHYSFEGGGKRFKPLEKMTLEN